MALGKQLPVFGKKKSPDTLNLQVVLPIPSCAMGVVVLKLPKSAKNKTKTLFHLTQAPSPYKIGRMLEVPQGIFNPIFRLISLTELNNEVYMNFVPKDYFSK